jgi:hypothetical protein
VVEEAYKKAVAERTRIDLNYAPHVSH